MTNTPSPPAQAQQMELSDSAPTTTALLDLVPVPLLYVAPRLRPSVDIALENLHTRANAAWIELCGDVLEEDATVADWLTLTYPEASYRTEVGTILLAALRAGLDGPPTRYELSTLVRCASGERRWLEIVSEIGPASRAGFVVTLRDPQLRQAQPASAAAPPVRGDPLSDLPDRQTALDRIDMEWNRFKRSGTPFSLVLFEIDRRDMICREFGLPTEEFIVRQVAATLRNASRVIDAVTRWGDGGFLLIASATPGSDAAVLAERIRRTIEALDCSWYGHPVPVTISACYGSIREGQAWQTLLEEVIAALAAGRQKRMNSVHRSAP